MLNVIEFPSQKRNQVDNIINEEGCKILSCKTWEEGLVIFKSAIEKLEDARHSYEDISYAWEKMKLSLAIVESREC